MGVHRPAGRCSQIVPGQVAAHGHTPTKSRKDWPIPSMTVSHPQELPAMPRASRPITVTLGDLQQGVQARVKSGAYASASEVMRAALPALHREEAAVNDWLRQRVDESLADPRPNVSPANGFNRLRPHPARRSQAPP